MMRALLAAGIVAILATGVCLLFVHDEGRQPSSDGESQEPERGNAEPAGPVQGPPEPAVPALPHKARIARVEQIHVTGTVLGVDARSASGVGIMAWLKSGWAHDAERQYQRASGIVRADGTFDLEMKSTLKKSVVLIRLQVNHALFSSASVTIDAQRPARTDARGSHYKAVVRLHPVFVLAGTVISRADRELHGASVAVFPMAAAGPHTEASGSDEVFDRRGAPRVWKYRLTVAEPGPYLVAACADGHAPAWQFVTVGPERTMDVGKLALGIGESIQGTVHFRGKAVDGALIVAERKAVEGRIYLEVGRYTMEWHEGRLRRQGARANGDEEGRFHIGGLAAATYALRLDDAGRLYLHESLRQARQASVAAPAKNAKLEFGAVHVFIEVLGYDEATMERLRIVTEVDNVSQGDYGEERLDFWVARGASVTVKIAGRGFTEQSRKFLVPNDASELTQRFKLEPAARFSLAVKITADGRPVTRAGFVLRHRDAQDDDSNSHHDSISESGVHRIEPSGRGRYRLIVRPGSDWNDSSADYVDEARDVEVPSSGELLLVVQATLGGRARIAVRGPQGELIYATCTIQTERDEKVDTLFTSHRLAAGGADYVSGACPSITASALPPGRYKALIKGVEGYESKTVPFTIEAGKTADVNVTLSRKR